MKKKIIVSILLAVLVLANVLALTACEDPSYKASTEFFFSSDGGSTYGNRRMEFEVGESVLMQLRVVVLSTDEKDKTEIQVTLGLENIDSVDAHYLKGQKIVPTKDPLTGVTEYKFTITPNEEWLFFFEFIPNSAGMYKMELTYDDTVSGLYDVINTIKFTGANSDTTGGNDSDTESGE